MVVEEGRTGRVLRRMPSLWLPDMIDISRRSFVWKLKSLWCPICGTLLGPWTGICHGSESLDCGSLICGPCLVICLWPGGTGSPCLSTWSDLDSDWLSIAGGGRRGLDRERENGWLCLGENAR